MKEEIKLKQSNNLILATHKMSAQQMKVFFYICSQFNGDTRLTLSFEQMNKILNPNRGTKQVELLLSSISSMMRNAFVDLKIDEDDEYWNAPVFILARKKKNSDDMCFEFNPHVTKELEVLRGYTWMYLSQLTGMSSRYAIRMYEFFAMRLGSQSRKETFDFEIERLRIYLNCTEKYKRFDLFENRVLKKIKDEINEKTNIKMNYKKIKKGRTISNIKFTFSWKNNDVINVQIKDDDILPGQTSIGDFDDELKDDELKEMMERFY